jgi:signal transduction histidine kinase/FixJ family two-component response regulator
LRLGAVDYLQKPVGKNEVLKAVRNALHVKHLSDEKMRLEKENQAYTNHLEQLVEERTHALAESEAALRYRAEELSILNRLARKVNESVSVDDVVRYGLQEIVNAVEPDLAAFFLVEEDHLVPMGLLPGHASSLWQPNEGHKVGTCLCGLAVSEDSAIYSADIRSDSRCTLEECRKAGYCSFAALPLRSGNEIIGVLGVASVQPKDFEKHSSFLEALASEMSIGLNKSLLYEQVQQHALELQESLTRIKESEAERLRLQENLQRSQKLEAIGTLASGIAHDFNNILSAIIGYAELALFDIPKESATRYNLDMVLAAGERAKDLIKQILAFSHQSKKDRKPIQIAHTIKEVLKFIRASLPTTIEIRYQVGSELGYVLADPVHIQQVVMNLCTNAHHAMSDKGGVIDIQLASFVSGPEHKSVHPDLKLGTYVKLTVKDTGCGMDRATMEKIFDPYFTTKEKGVGTGLGLAVLHGIVREHGGVIMVDSEPGKGTVFDIYFPAIQKTEVSETQTHEQEILGGNEHILFIDDEHALVEMGKTMLERMGYSVETRTSSVDALALFKAHPQRYDLVITDMTMPNMTGVEVAEELFRIRPDIPIILCTGYGEPLIEERAKSAGIRTFVMKPVLLSEMAKAIQEALGKEQD